jgi:hypothetical protein
MRVPRGRASALQWSYPSAPLRVAVALLVVVPAGLVIDAMDDGETSIDLVPLAVAFLLAVFLWLGCHRGGGEAP